MRELLAVALGVYVAVTYALALVARAKIHDVEDFLVAGRRLPLALAAATLLATWFGAGTLLTAADAIAGEGLHKIALEPLGAGLCLLLAGWLLAERLWSLRLLTVADFFGRRFGRRAERLAAILTVPTFLGWIAVQFLALAGILEVFFALPRTIGAPLVAAVATGYTLLGGMWSVAVTDALQLALLVLGLGILAWSVVTGLGDGSLGGGLVVIAEAAPPGHLDLLPPGGAVAIADWLGILAVAAIGNLAGQDLLARIFAARSPVIARRACQVAGVAYLIVGAIPVVLGLAAAGILGPDENAAVLPRLASLHLSPGLAVIFTLAVTSAVFSTIDSALLAPASVLAQNLLGPSLPGIPALTLNRLAILGIAGLALLLALSGPDAYSLLEDAYALGLVALVVPLIAGLYRRPRGEGAALAAMIVGAGAWVLHLALGWRSFGGPALGLPLPQAMGSALLSLIAFRLGEACALREKPV